MTQQRFETSRVSARVLLAAAAWAFFAPTAMSGPEQPAATVIAADASVNGTTIHYLRSGTGATTVLLLHGWPESSHEWHKVIPLLSSQFTVIAPDLRGVGGSHATPSGYDKVSLAEDVHELVVQLGLSRVFVIGHDIGGMVAYAYARSHPEDLGGIAIVDIPIAGVDPWDAVKNAPWAWHFGFHTVPGLAEALVAGREDAYFQHFYDDFSVTPSAISSADRQIYADAYRNPESLKAGFELYRTFPQDEAYNRSHRAKLSVPILVAGGDHSAGPMVPMLEKGLRAAGADSVKEAVIENCGHWIPEEQPEALVS